MALRYEFSSHNIFLLAVVCISSISSLLCIFFTTKTFESLLKNKAIGKRFRIVSLFAMIAYTISSIFYSIYFTCELFEIHRHFLIATIHDFALLINPFGSLLLLIFFVLRLHMVFANTTYQVSQYKWLIISLLISIAAIATESGVILWIIDSTKYNAYTFGFVSCAIVVYAVVMFWLLKLFISKLHHLANNATHLQQVHSHNYNRSYVFSARQQRRDHGHDTDSINRSDKHNGNHGNHDHHYATSRTRSLSVSHTPRVARVLSGTITHSLNNDNSPNINTANTNTNAKFQFNSNNFVVNAIARSLNNVNTADNVYGQTDGAGGMTTSENCQSNVTPLTRDGNCKQGRDVDGTSMRTVEAVVSGPSRSGGIGGVPDHAELTRDHSGRSAHSGHSTNSVIIKPNNDEDIDIVEEIENENEKQNENKSGLYIAQNDGKKEHKLVKSIEIVGDVTLATRKKNDSDKDGDRPGLEDNPNGNDKHRSDINSTIARMTKENKRIKKNVFKNNKGNKSEITMASLALGTKHMNNKKNNNLNSSDESDHNSDINDDEKQTKVNLGLGSNYNYYGKNKNNMHNGGKILVRTFSKNTPIQSDIDDNDDDGLIGLPSLPPPNGMIMQASGVSQVSQLSQMSAQTSQLSQSNGSQSSAVIGIKFDKQQTIESALHEIPSNSHTSRSAVTNNNNNNSNNNNSNYSNIYGYDSSHHRDHHQQPRMMYKIGSESAASNVFSVTTNTSTNTNTNTKTNDKSNISNNNNETFSHNGLYSASSSGFNLVSETPEQGSGHSTPHAPVLLDQALDLVSVDFGKSNSIHSQGYGKHFNKTTNINTNGMVAALTNNNYSLSHNNQNHNQLAHPQMTSGHSNTNTNTNTKTSFIGVSLLTNNDSYCSDNINTNTNTKTVPSPLSNASNASTSPHSLGQPSPNSLNHDDHHITIGSPRSGNGNVSGNDSNGGCASAASPRSIHMHMHRHSRRNTKFLFSNNKDALHSQSMRHQKELITTVTKYTVLLTVAMLTTGFIGVISAIRVFITHPWFLFVQETMLSVDASCNIICLMLQFSFSHKEYVKICCICDKCFQSFYFRQFGLHLVLGNPKK